MGNSFKVQNDHKEIHRVEKNAKGLKKSFKQAMFFFLMPMYFPQSEYKPLWVDTKTLYIASTNEKSGQSATNYYNSKTCMFRAFLGGKFPSPKATFGNRPPGGLVAFLCAREKLLNGNCKVGNEYLPYVNIYIWVFPKIRVFPPKWMVKIMENPIKMDDLGGTPILETPIYIYITYKIELLRLKIYSFSMLDTYQGSVLVDIF